MGLSKTVLAVFWLGPFAFLTVGGDQPQWGSAWNRNLASTEKNLPASFDLTNHQTLKWRAALGRETHSTPVVAGGRVYIGTNNDQPRDPKQVGDRGVLICFDEATGRFLWQLVVPKREEDRYHDWPKSGISSPATVEGNRVYLVNNRGELLCLDAEGMANGNDGPFQDEGRKMVGTNGPPVTPGKQDADILWLLDLTRAAGIWSHDAAHSSILIRGNHLYLNSGTGVDNTHRKIRTPDAPGMVVVDKRTGKYLARDEEKTAPNIFHCTWASPSMGIVGGRELIFFAGGNGVLYAFNPLSSNYSPPGDQPAKLEKVFEFDFDPDAPRTEVHRFTTNKREGPSNLYGMPVLHENRIYLAGGGDLFWGKVGAWLKCIDATGTGNVTRTAERWSYPLNRHVISTVALHNGLVFIADIGKTIHCVDAQTGKAYWTQEAKGDFWASPLVADGKVYIGSRRGDFWILAAEKEKKVLWNGEMGDGISATATAANGVVYVATMSELFAFQKPR